MDIVFSPKKHEKYWTNGGKNTENRMHSSRMRTVRCRGRLIGGVCLGVYTSPPPWTEFLTHACEKIAFLQLHLRMVKKQECIPVGCIPPAC